MIFFRYLIITSIAYAIDLGGFVLLLSFHFALIGPLFASILSKLSSSIFSFIAHRHVTFDAQKNNNGVRQALRYFSLVLFNTQLSTLVLMLLLNWIIDPIKAKILADIFCFILSYWLSKSFIFTKTPALKT